MWATLIRDLAFASGRRPGQHTVTVTLVKDTARYVFFMIHENHMMIL